MASKKKSIQRSCTSADVALTALALCGDDAAKAHRFLKEQGRSVPVSTIKSWRNHVHVDRYYKLRDGDLVGQINRRMAADWETAALKHLAKHTEALDQVDPTKLSPAERIKFLQSNAIAAGISTDKSQLLRGNPTEIVQTQNAEELIGALARIAPGMVIDSTAEDITDVTVLDSGT